MKTFCAYFNEGLCRSCSKLELGYREGLREKEQVLKDLIAPVFTGEMLPSVPSKEKEFRNKAKFSVTGTLDSPIIGLVGEAALDEGRELLNCPLHVPPINQALPRLKEFIRAAKLIPYRIKEKKGELKGIILFFSPDTGEGYLRLVLRSQESLDRIRKQKDGLLKDLPWVKSFSVNLQPVPHAILEGEEEIFLTESTFCKASVGGIAYEVHPQGFVQTNQAAASALYAAAASWIQESGARTFAELFSGQGAFSFAAAQAVESGVGVEINKRAVEAANKTASKYQLPLTFLASDAKEAGALLKETKADVLLVNPPRRGLGTALTTVKEAGAKFILYSSCSAETLASDLNELNDRYEVQRVQLFDMFPHTAHFETLVLLCQRER